MIINANANDTNDALLKFSLITFIIINEFSKQICAQNLSSAGKQ